MVGFALCSEITQASDDFGQMEGGGLSFSLQINPGTCLTSG